MAISKSKTKFNLKLSFKAGSNCNTKLPYTFLKESFAEVETKCIGHFLKNDPSKPWGDIEVIVDVQEKTAIPNPPAGSIHGAIFIGDSRHLGCSQCNKLNDMNATNCIQCGSRLIPEGVGISVGTGDDQDGYFEMDI